MSFQKSNREHGAHGEQLAEKYLQKKKFKIIARNVRTPFGEIDMIAKEHKTLVFVEVKLRRSTQYGLPQEAVTAAKRKKIIDSAQWYCTIQRLQNTPCRFDVIAVQCSPGQSPEIDHLRNAFTLDDI